VAPRKTDTLGSVYRLVLCLPRGFDWSASLFCNLMSAFSDPLPSAQHPFKFLEVWWQTTFNTVYLTFCLFRILTKCVELAVSNIRFDLGLFKPNQWKLERFLKEKLKQVRGVSKWVSGGSCCNRCKKVVDARIRTHAGMNYIIREHYHPTPTVNNRLYTARYELG
jgi:hypothetical protein